MKVLVLFSGSDRRFEKAGYQYPKNLVEIHGKSLMQHVLENNANILQSADTVIFTIKKAETDRFHTALSARLLCPRAKIIQVPGRTDGAVCTALLAVKYIDDDELLIMNGDIILNESIQDAIDYFAKEHADGGAITFESVHPRWSYVKCNEAGFMIEAAEKRPISRNATIGIYYYKNGLDFVDAAKEAIRKNARVDGVFYICPVFNEMILHQKKLLTYKVNGEKYHSLATPDGVEKYRKFLENGDKYEKG